MQEAIEIIKKLFTGKVAKHDGEYFTMERAKIWTRARGTRRRSTSRPPGPISAKWTGRELRRLHHRRRGRREAQDAARQVREGRARGRQGPEEDAEAASSSTCRGPKTEEEAIDERARAVAERRHALPQGRHPHARGLRRDRQAGAARELQEPHDHLARHGRARAQIQQFVDLGFDEIHVHNVGRNQEEFIKAYGERVVPALVG